MLEALSSQGQELWDRCDVPVRVGDAGVTDVGGQHIDDVIDALLLLIAAHQRAAEECMAEVMDAWHGVVAAPDPPESGAERRERVMHHAIAQGCPLIGHQERLDPPITDAQAATVVGWSGTRRDFRNFVWRTVREAAGRSTSVGVSASASEIRSPVLASNPNKVPYVCARSRSPVTGGSCAAAATSAVTSASV